MPVTAAASLAAIRYALPAAVRSVRELAAAGAVSSAPELLERFGFGRVRVAEEETPYDLAREAAGALLREEGIDPASIDAVVYGGAPGAVAFARPGDAAEHAPGVCDMRRFHSPATRLQYELGLERATVLALDQLACTTLFGAVRVARALCAAEGLERVLCVASEFFPAAAGREAIANCTSDAACALLVRRGGARNRIVGAATVTKGYYWEGDALRDEVIASYFPTALHVLRRTIADAGWSAADVDWVVPHNVSTTSWEVLLGLVGLPRARLWAANIARVGHTLAGDNFINLRDALADGTIAAGDRVLLFSYGYGAHWTALAVEA
ncbi:MAG TPA: 3-oxoacyl-[acyl-carrier-protein] synthase III C-terminal domain-containing protein [Gemmatimonadaceae bacterium]|nr:3-oxoacyl-[acyl-carrier-protein] synthase III C-terminal domain-containing protein [Gemmatimonadaceae bacterium]